MSKKNFVIIFILISLGFTGFSIASAQESTDSANSVREKVKEKIENVLNKPKAYLGTITDKTGVTLQIKNLKGEINFISVDPDNSVFVSVAKTTKSIKYDDLALGDFVIAMGYIEDQSTGIENGNSVLNAKRTLVTEEVAPTTRKIVFGTVVGIEKKILSLNSGSGEAQFEFPKRWKGPEIEMLKTRTEYTYWAEDFK